MNNTDTFIWKKFSPTDGSTFPPTGHTGKILCRLSNNFFAICDFSITCHGWQYFVGNDRFESVEYVFYGHKVVEWTILN